LTLSSRMVLDLATFCASISQVDLTYGVTVLVQIYAAPVHTSSVNSISFAPQELGLMLAAASSDGSLSVLALQADGSWSTERVRRCKPVFGLCFWFILVGLGSTDADKIGCGCSLLGAQIEQAHPLGSTSVSWSPAVPKGSLVSAKGPGQPVKRFVSGGCDASVKVSPTMQELSAHPSFAGCSMLVFGSHLVANSPN
jgi:WD40 repeat protein